MTDIARAGYGALLLRISLGVLFLMHGLYLKAFVYGMSNTAEAFQSMGLPGWFAWLVMIYESVGGLALIFGVYVRPVALLLGVHMLAATFMGHAANGWLFTNPNGGYEFPLFWSIACFALALTGGGVYSITNREGATYRG